MSLRDDLLRRVLEHPDDNDPRQAYADFLEEAGEADRAEFIRVQMELARDGYWPCGKTRRRDLSLLARQRDLLKRHEARWLIDDWGRRCGVYNDNDGWKGGIKWHWDRGFVCRVECPTNVLMGGRCSNSFCTNGMALEDHDGKAGYGTCQTCHGTGHTYAIAKALGESVPITSVVLTDLEAWHFSPSPYIWYDADRAIRIHPQSNVPGPIWGLIDLPLVGGGRSQKSAESRADADQALAKAAALYCRKLAGLAGLSPNG